MTPKSGPAKGRRNKNKNKTNVKKKRHKIVMNIPKEGQLQRTPATKKDNFRTDHTTEKQVQKFLSAGETGRNVKNWGKMWRVTP